MVISPFLSNKYLALEFFGAMFSRVKTLFVPRTRHTIYKAPVLAGVLLGLGYVWMNNDVPHENDPNFELVQVQLVTRHGIRAPQRLVFLLPTSLPCSEGRVPQKYKEFGWECVERNDDGLAIMKNGDRIEFEEYKTSFGM